MTDPASLLYEQLARIGKAVASPHRIEMLDLLAQGEKSVEALAEEAGLSIKNTSAQLKVLREAQLVECRKAAQFCFYRLADDAVASFTVALRELAERRLAEMREFSEAFRKGRERMNAVDRRDLMARIRKGEVIVLDVRPATEFQSGHIAGARSVPLAELEKALGTLPKSKEIVAYCRGPYCGLSEKAVTLLRSRGFRASRIHDGVIDWRDAGLPVTRPSQSARRHRQHIEN